MDGEFEPQAFLRDIDLGAYASLTVATAADGAGVLVVEVETEQYGTGSALSSALTDLAESLSEYHEFLRTTDAQHLSPHLRAHLEFLDNHRIRDSQRVRPLAV